MPGLPTKYYSASQDKEVEIKSMNSFHLTAALVKTAQINENVPLITALKQEVIERLDAFEKLKEEV